MEQSNAKAYPQDTGPSASLPLQGGGVTGVIVDSRFCASYPVEMAFDRGMMQLTAGNIVITDVKGNMLFKVQDRVFGLHDKRILLDGFGSPVLTLQEKMMTMHCRWKVFRGGSTEPGDLLYTVKRTSVVQMKMKLDVFLSHNKEKKTCDFQVRGNWFEGSSTVYVGESDVIVAQMDKKDVVSGKINFSVSVYPNVDIAFIASLIVVILYPNANHTALTLLPLAGLGAIAL
ncbi:Protein LURP-one-related 15 [Cardamine amara subsp. amara]|uniref:Protein LURP-one-related 15 n=1 Tax=Cardamine amara subsp. amara TaxID=228776 RepID=A0ABD1BI57_CARAN